MIEYLRRQFAYDAWANLEVLAALAVVERASPRPRQLLAHILSAQRLWLERIRNQPQSLPVWPDFTLDQCRTQGAEMAQLWKEYAASLTPGDLSRQVSYLNTKGQPWTSTVQDILTHVLLHSAYHRGQIASATRSAGEQPASTDFIRATREHLIE